MRYWSKSIEEPGRGGFAADTASLLSLFADVEPRGSGRWREPFGLVRGADARRIQQRPLRSASA